MKILIISIQSGCKSNQNIDHKGRPTNVSACAYSAAARVVLSGGRARSEARDGVGKRACAGRGGRGRQTRRDGGPRQPLGERGAPLGAAA